MWETHRQNTGQGGLPRKNDSGPDVKRCVAGGLSWRTGLVGTLRDTVTPLSQGNTLRSTPPRERVFWDDLFPTGGWVCRGTPRPGRWPRGGPYASRDVRTDVPKCPSTGNLVKRTYKTSFNSGHPEVALDIGFANRTGHHCQSSLEVSSEPL